MSEDHRVIFSTDAAQQVSDGITTLLQQSRDPTMSCFQQMHNIADANLDILPQWHDKMYAFMEGTQARYIKIIQMYHRHIINHLAQQIAIHSQAEATLDEVSADEL